jgi:hypothetical protein
LSIGKHDILLYLFCTSFAQAIYSPKSVPHVLNSRYEQFSGPHSIFSPQSSENTAKHQTGRLSKQQGYCYPGYLKKMLQMTMPANLPSIETEPSDPNKFITMPRFVSPVGLAGSR